MATIKELENDIKKSITLLMDEFNVKPDLDDTNTFIDALMKPANKDGQKEEYLKLLGLERNAEFNYIKVKNDPNDCQFQGDLNNKYLHIDYSLDTDKINNDVVRTYRISIKNYAGAIHYENKEKYIENENLVTMYEWVLKCIHQQNILKKEQSFLYYFGRHHCFSINVSNDTVTNFHIFELLIRGFETRIKYFQGQKKEKEKAIDDFLSIYKIRTCEDDIVYYSYAIFIYKVLMISNHSVWIFFPKLSSANEKNRFLWASEKLINELINLIKKEGIMKINIHDIDMDSIHLLSHLDMMQIYNKDNIKGANLVDIMLHTIFRKYNCM